MGPDGKVVVPIKGETFKETEEERRKREEEEEREERERKVWPV